ncbi:hypothetical protein ACJMK2_024441 [Sinanodonta woodiana]|uniref:Uncharacterized protein n=1 Tax=Sinanodonta woodiana TaxID=1069815 RepID=A0ABD3XHB2_SINWO
MKQRVPKHHTKLPETENAITPYQSKWNRECQKHHTNQNGTESVRNTIPVKMEQRVSETPYQSNLNSARCTIQSYRKQSVRNTIPSYLKQSVKIPYQST